MEQNIFRNLSEPLTGLMLRYIEISMVVPEGEVFDMVETSVLFPLVYTEGMTKEMT